MSATEIDNTSQGFTEEERAAMKERAKERKEEARANKNRAAGENDVTAKIDAMPESDRTLAKRLHEIITASALDLWPKTQKADGSSEGPIKLAKKYDERIRSGRSEAERCGAGKPSSNII